MCCADCCDALLHHGTLSADGCVSTMNMDGDCSVLISTVPLVFHVAFATNTGLGLIQQLLQCFGSLHSGQFTPALPATSFHACLRCISSVWLPCCYVAATEIAASCVWNKDLLGLLRGSHCTPGWLIAAAQAKLLTSHAPGQLALVFAVPLGKQLDWSEANE